MNLKGLAVGLKGVAENSKGIAQEKLKSIQESLNEVGDVEIEENANVVDKAKVFLGKNFSEKNPKRKRNLIMSGVAMLIVLIIITGIFGSGGNSGKYDDDTLIAMAFHEWITTDTQANLLYNNYSCVWEGRISGSNGDSVTVYLQLYNGETYNSLKSMGMDTSGAEMLNGTVKLYYDEIG